MSNTTLPPRVKDITGQKFGRLTAIRFVRWHNFPTSKRKPVWECVCDCGKTTTVISINLFSGHTKSCACLEDENRANRVRLNTKHGDARKGQQSHLYKVWCSMKQRCEDVNYRLYPRWGGRGIKIEWGTYEDFKRDMLASYRPKLEIERIDNNGPYSKSNCRWATDKEQALNTRRNRFIIAHGLKMTHSEWSEAFGWPKCAVGNRMRAGWSEEEALTTPYPSFIKR